MSQKKLGTLGAKDIAKLNSMLSLAVKYHQDGKIPEAEAAYNEILKINPSNSVCYNNLGLIASDRGLYQAAEQLFKKSCEINRKNSDAYNNLGNTYRAQGKIEEAIASLEQALRINPAASGAHVNLGNIFQAQGNFERAIICYEQALRISPEFSEAWSNLGNTYNRINQVDKSAQCYIRALAVRPDYADAYNNLGNALRSQSKLDQAVPCFERALRLRPNYLDAYLNLGNTHTDMGRTDQAVACYQQILALKPDHVDALTNMLFSLNYSDTIDPRVLTEHHLANGAKIESLAPPSQSGHANIKDPNRKLRVGYVSPDFRRHAVSFFFEPLMQAHDRNAVEIFCYAEVFAPDHITAKLQTLSDHWMSTLGVGDDDLAARIRADGIDILVDLAGHSAHNRLPAFARRPAPVQITWLGYPNTTGLKSVGYRLVDAVTDPEDVADTQASETLVRLDGGFLCYQPPADAPEPTPPPCRETGFITFGSFNNLAKLSSATFDAWGKLLSRLPTARLAVKSRFFAEEGPRTLFLSRLAARGVAAERVILMDAVLDTTEHLATYHKVDIALDPFPYNGTTTTCEVLWMGVPVVTLAGNRHAGRVGASLLQSVGLDELVAHDPDEYVEIAARLASDPAALANLRSGLRARMAASPLCDAPAFARKLEAAYRRLWSDWCGEAAAPLPTSAPSPAPVPVPAASSAPFVPQPPVSGPRLHFGESGIEAKPGWTMINARPGEQNDFVSMRIALSQIANDSVAEIYASHVLEHLNFRVELPTILAEFRRVLGPEGTCRISVPDMDVLGRLIADPQATPEHKLFLMAHLFGGQGSEYDFHKVGLNFDILLTFLSHAGFRSAGRVEEFGLFQDCSSLKRFGVAISLNVEAHK